MRPAGDLDVAVVGGGIIGLATAYRLLERRPGLRLAVIEKEPELARHQSGHNSGVLHAGVYYAPGSLKATLCREGKTAVERFAETHGIPVRHPGKLVVALTEGSCRRSTGSTNAPGRAASRASELVGPERIRELEPHAAGIRGLWSPRSGIVDFRAVALAIADEIRAHGGEIHTDRRVTGLTEGPAGVTLATSRGELRAGQVIACAGLQADRVAAMSGRAGRSVPRIVPFRGDYYRLAAGGATTRRPTALPGPGSRASRSSASTSPRASTARCGPARTPSWPSPARATGGRTSTCATWPAR